MNHKVSFGALIPMRSCLHCGKETQSNYCDWDCSVAHARASQGREVLPNGLPVRCIRADGTMLEHEHADHPDYLFPVTALYVGQDDSRFYWAVGGGPEGETTEYVRFTPEEQANASREVHAVIYADKNIAVTMYEYCYCMWDLHDGKSMGGSLWERGEWQLTEEDRKNILEPRNEKGETLEQWRKRRNDAANELLAEAKLNGLVDLETLDTAKRAEEKQASLEQDDQDIADGKKTVEQVSLDNGPFARLGLQMDMDSARKKY